MLAGRLDILLGAITTGESDDVILISDSYRQDPLGFYVLKSNIKKFENETITSLVRNGFKLGLLSHDHRSEELVKMIGYAKKTKNIPIMTRVKALLRNINNGILEGVIVHSAEVDYLKHKNDPLVDDLMLVPHLSFSTNVSMIMGVESPLGKGFIHRINDSIKRLKATGTHKKLLHQHVPTHFTLSERKQ